MFCSRPVMCLDCDDEIDGDGDGNSVLEDNSRTAISSFGAS